MNESSYDDNKEGKGSISSADEESNQISRNLGAQDQEQDDENANHEPLSSSVADVLPPEVLEALPEEAREQVVGGLSIMAMHGSSRQSSPIAKNIKPEHITQIIGNSEKESQREFEKSKISETTKRLGMGAILSLVVIVFVYAGVTKDKDLSEKVFLAGISAIGGFGAGYAFGKDK